MNKLKKQFSGIMATTAVLLCSALSPFASASAATTSILLGDANGDNVVNIADVACMIQYLHKAYAINSKNFTAMDVNEDGIIDVTDQYMLQYYEAYHSSPTKVGTTVNKECYTLPLNTSLQYRRHDCSDSNPKSYKTYTVPAGEIMNSIEDTPVTYASQDNNIDTENVACVQISSNIGFGSGFIVSNDTIATAAHCIYDYSSKKFLENITVKVHTTKVNNGQSIPVTYTASAEYLHIPTKYIRATDCDVNYDYALIRVGDFKDENSKKVNVSNYCVNLGIMTDTFINAEKENLTSVGYFADKNDGNKVKRYQSTGVINPDIPSHEYTYRYHIDAEFIGGKSGGMTYFDSSYTNPNNQYTINTRSTVGINTSIGAGYNTYGVRTTPDVIRFLNTSHLYEGD